MAIKKIRKAQKQTIPEYRANNVLFVIITDGEEKHLDLLGSLHS